jgi:hypothetical protein
MSFMQPYVWKSECYEIETTEGLDVVETAVSGLVKTTAGLADYLSGRPLNDELPEPQVRWLCRLSAPGYLDYTDTSAYDTEQEAIQSLLEMYGREEEAEDWEAEAEERLKELAAT